MKTISFFSFFRELTKSLLTPLPLFWLLLIAAFVFYLADKKRIARWFLGSSLLWFFLISTPFLPKALLATLENQYPPVQLTAEKRDQVSAQDSIAHILVLGSGFETDDRLSFCSKLNLTGLARLAEGIRLQRLLPASKLIFSGYAGDQPLPQAEVTALAAQELGTDSTVIYTICEPWNTRTEAEEYLKHFGTNCKLYLITDAAHMPRTLMHFRHAGLNPIPAPTNFVIRKNNIPGSYTDYFPSSGNIRNMEIVFQEYLGMLWAKIGGD
ncbi:MAG: ElyC/SanA/YdcF family protein [Bacteroidales bacterium]|nr:ElyC/SanA/YdcF family protein [Bacteroidales bacterium]